jgi:iron complex outermembrane receptor protein
MSSEWIDLTDTDFSWGIGRRVVIDEVGQELTRQGLSPPRVAEVMDALGEVTPTTLSGASHVMRQLDPNTGDLVQVDDVRDVEPLQESTTQTLEAGYKGALGNKLVLGVDLYHKMVKNFVGPLLIETPNVFLDAETVESSLMRELGTSLDDNPAANAVLLTLDDPSLGGNGDGSVLDELVGRYVAGATAIPYGTVTPAEAFDQTAILLTYRNFGDIALTGVDFRFDYHLRDSWSVGFNYSYVSRGFFGSSASQPQDIALNAPQNKIGANLRYGGPDRGLEALLRFRWIEGFPVVSGVYVGDVESYEVVDLNVRYDLAFSPNTRVTVLVQNLFDERHAEFVGAPTIGRLAILRINQSF